MDIQSSSYPQSTWRLVHTAAQDGPTNMAIDEAILEAVTAGRVPPTLRFYAWNPPCLSIGFSQPAGEIDHQTCAQRGWQVVRRPTGGQAILHTDELTYSVCAPLAEPRVAGGIIESYGRLSAGLLSGLRHLGLTPAEARPEYPVQNHEHNPACFAEPARYEVTVDLSKLIGSAQSRRLGGVLQHGTLPLGGNILRIIDGLAFASQQERDAAQRDLATRALTLESAMGRPVTFAKAAKAMAVGFAQALNLDLAPADLSHDELKAAQRIRTAKYANRAWTHRK